MNYRSTISFIIFLSLGLGALCFFNLTAEERTVLNVLGILGFTLSFIGVVIAYFQILSIKNITIETQNKVNASLALNSKILMISDLSRKVAMVDEIQGYLRADKIELCLLRMKDLKSLLNSLSNQKQYSSLVSQREFNNIRNRFMVDLINLQNQSFEKGNELDRAKIHENLEGLSTAFSNVEIALKTSNHDI